MDVTAEYYKTVLDNLYDGIYFIDNDKKILYWNKGAEKHTGYKHTDVIGRHCCEILKHADKKGVKLCNGKCPVSHTIADSCLREVGISPS
jgi:PAS domain S-box-containing protein